jgi:hypothetical protein
MSKKTTEVYDPISEMLEQLLKDRSESKRTLKSIAKSILHSGEPELFPSSS